ncbi:exported hypothetical protein [Corynebacterium striatum]|nr:exported hypothetical protein [Corynebacterium striatum]
MVALLFTAAGIYGLVVVAGAVGADSVGFVVTVTLIGVGFALFVGGSLERYLPASVWRRFSLSRAASRRWGVDCFNAFLWRIGWNKHIVAMRKRDLGSYRRRLAGSGSPPNDRDNWPCLSGPIADPRYDAVEGLVVSGCYCSFWSRAKAPFQMVVCRVEARQKTAKSSFYPVMGAEQKELLEGAGNWVRKSSWSGPGSAAEGPAGGGGSGYLPAFSFSKRSSRLAWTSRRRILPIWSFARDSKW